MLEAEEEKEEERGASSRDASSDSYSASDSDADADSGSARSYSSYSSYDSEGSFDRDAYEEYWDGEEAKHAVALRSPFKMFPGWGATVSPAPSPGGDGGPRKSPLNESRVAFTDDCEEMQTVFFILGPVLYTDDDGTVVHVEDNVGRIEHCKKAYKLNGLGEDFVDQFIR